MSAEEEKSKGNAAMGQKNYEEAVKHYTAAISLDPTNHVLYSNRSAAYANWNKYEEALKDGEKTIEIKPDWAKGYSRKGLALYKLGKVQEAVSCYNEGLKIEPDNAALKQSLSEIESTSNAGLNMFANMFNSPNFWTMMQMDPELKELLKQEDFVTMINNIQKNPQTLNLYMQDKRLMTVITKLLQSNLGGAAGTPPPTNPSSTPDPTPTKKEPEPKPEPEPEPEIEVDPNVKQALDEKEKGNAAYKKKDFDAAITHYDKAFELNPKEMTFLTNRAAANMEAKRYEQAIKDCEKAIEVGRSQYAPYELIAKAYSRMGAVYKRSGNIDKAIESYQTSLTEDRTRATQKILRQLEKEKEQKDKEAYMDPKLALEAKERGNEAFKNSQFPKAVSCYTEAIERDPTNAPYYSNRAAAYMKLADFGYAFKDCEKCLELDPTFVKAYKRLAVIHNFNKDYHKAIEAYKKAQEYTPDDADLKNGIQHSTYLLTKAQSDPEEREIRRKRAMQDPEIQKIFSNPIMERLLQNLSKGGDQATAMKMMADDPSLKESFEKLVASGAVAMG